MSQGPTGDPTRNNQNLPNLQEGSRSKPPIKRPYFTVEQVGWPSRACARRLESEPVERDEPCALKLRPEVSPRKDECDGDAAHPTP
jgi:hypothetical protein